MTEYMLYEFKADDVDVMKLPVKVFPVRKSRVDEIFGGDSVAFDLLLDELDFFLAEHPQQVDRYRETVGLIAYTLGVELGSEGFHKASAHYLEIGLTYNPDNISLRANYAVALQSLGRFDDALVQYEYIINDPEVDVTPLVWVLAARLHARRGEYMRGYQLLRECSLLLPEEDGFWEFLGELRDKAGVDEIEITVSDAEPIKSSKKFCPRCGSGIKSGARFCSGCGESLEEGAG